MVLRTCNHQVILTMQSHDENKMIRRTQHRLGNWFYLQNTYMCIYRLINWFWRTCNHQVILPMQLYDENKMIRRTQHRLGNRFYLQNTYIYKYKSQLTTPNMHTTTLDHQRIHTYQKNTLMDNLKGN